MVGQGEVPDPQGDGQPQGPLPCPAASGQGQRPADIRRPGGRAGRRPRRAGSGSSRRSRRDAGKSSGTIGSGSGPIRELRPADSGRTRPAIALPAGPSNDQLGLDRISIREPVAAEQDLEGDELVPRRVECDPALGGVPEVIGGQVALGLGGDQFARDGMDLVQLVEDGDLDRSQATAGSSVAADGARLVAVAGPGQWRGEPVGDPDGGRRRRPEIAGRIDGPHRQHGRRAGGQASGRAGASRPGRPARRPAGSARAAARGRRAPRRTRACRPGRRRGA